MLIYNRGPARPLFSTRTIVQNGSLLPSTPSNPISFACSPANCAVSCGRLALPPATLPSTAFTARNLSSWTSSAMAGTRTLSAVTAGATNMARVPCNRFFPMAISQAAVSTGTEAAIPSSFRNMVSQHHHSQGFTSYTPRLRLDIFVVSPGSCRLRSLPAKLPSWPQP